MTVQLRNLSRDFGSGPVLDGLDLDVAPGEFVALLGHSGSGKSTLLRTLAGLDVAPADAVLPTRRAVVFQEPRLLPWRRVWQNVALGLPLPAAAARARATAALGEVGLAHRVDAWPLTLSGGEGSRASLARALVRDPELLLLDEPFAALDALTRMRMQGLVADLWVRHRCSVLLVTHDVDEALLLADRALVLERGRIALEVSLPSDRPRRVTDAALAPVRAELLAALGVPPDVGNGDGGGDPHAARRAA